jgi:fatty-acid desaturase
VGSSSWCQLRSSNSSGVSKIDQRAIRQGEHTTHILTPVVEDEHVIASTLAAILKMNGFPAKFFTCPLDALTAARSKAPGKMKPGVPALSRDVQRQSLNWLILGFMVLFHVGAIVAVFFFSWSALIVAVALHVIAINVGIGMGYHRLLTHRGYQVPRCVEHLLAVCATLSLEGGPLVWVTTHRVHHRHTDRPGDPHSPHEGGWWSHAGWVIHGAGANAEPALLAKYAPDLIKDDFYRWLNRYHWVPLTLLGFVLLAVGGWRLVLWGIFLRVTLGLHATWLVNSATHMWGSRRFETRDDSRNSWWVALLTGGEGWHNNHHAYPVSARHGLAWYEFDPNYYGIWIMGQLGLATKINALTVAQTVINSASFTGTRSKI